jgi:rhamnosyltransferase
MFKIKYPKVSVVIRTLNEAKFLPECLSAISHQEYYGEIEIVIVDSGSEDDTISIALKQNLKLVHIKKEDFSFGRALNLGCEESNGDVLVFLSAHCIPSTQYWLINLIQPILENKAQYSYGRQLPREGLSRFSEGMVFKKYYPENSSVPQSGYFCNNANSAIPYKIWQNNRFNENLTGLEDMDLAKRIKENSGGEIAYVSTAEVEHIHEEAWGRIKIRYEREAVALASIDPSLNISLAYALRLFFYALISDWKASNTKSINIVSEIIMYRFCQFFGSFVGSRASKLRISKMKKEYFYPKAMTKPVTIGD